MKRPAYLPNPVNKLYRDALHGRLSRREVMKRGTALGLSSALMGTMLRAESVGAQGTPEGQEAGWAIPSAEEMQNELQLGDFSGVQFSFVTGAEGPETPFAVAAIRRFEEMTGAQVQLVHGPQSATDRLQFYLQSFAAQAADIDAMDIDVIWPGILAPHTIDLSDSMPEGEFFEAIVQNNTVNDALVGIPMRTDAGILYSRTDLIEEYGFEGPPETWDQLEEMAQTITEGEIADTPEFTGFVWQGNAYEGLTCNALEWQVSHGGGRIVTPEGEVELNNESAIEAFERAASWVGTISPTAVTGYLEEDARAVWQGGGAAFMRNWPYAYALGQDEGSVIQDLFTVGLLPSAEEGGEHAATLGGWQMAVSAYSQNQEVAAEFARYMCSQPIQKARAIEVAHLPTIASIYEDPDVLAAQPYYEQMFEVFAGGAVPRPSTPTADLYNEVSIAYFTGVHQILTGGGDAAAIVEDMASQIEDILEDL
ncbi:MAG: ABC transporter substrate-binding protein [Chloroflexota bacterium]|nr:ABC transporter substrate-binding protein [Chloroflexota bacterium]